MNCSVVLRGLLAREERNRRLEKRYRRTNAEDYETMWQFEFKHQWQFFEE